MATRRRCVWLPDTQGRVEAIGECSRSASRAEERHMIDKKRAGDGSSVEVTFRLPVDRRTAAVAVAGDFNAWDPTATPLLVYDDQRVAAVRLEAGRRYAFRYYADGEWFNDERADEYQPNEFGGYDCVIDLTDT
jgi:hypothetical protein